MKRNNIEKLYTRLNKLNINVRFVMNYPWVYLDTVNDVKVHGGTHGYVAFIHHHATDSFRLKDRPALFKKIRSLL